MKIEDAKSKRVNLEKLILESVKDYEDETGLSISSLSVVRYHGGASRNGIIESIDLEIKL